MKKINIPLKAHVLTLYPQPATKKQEQSENPQLEVLANGLAQPSFWSHKEINQAVAEASRIWLREAKIEFSLAEIATSAITVPSDDHGMWVGFLNKLSTRGDGIAIAFVHELPANDGGWGGGRIAIVSGKVARSGLVGFAGRILAHELGHILINSEHHSSSTNLMYASKHYRRVNPGLLEQTQIKKARTTATQITS